MILRRFRFRLLPWVLSRWLSLRIGFWVGWSRLLVHTLSMVMWIGKLVTIPLPGVLLSNLAQNSSIASCGAWCLSFLTVRAGMMTIGTSGSFATRESLEPASLPSYLKAKAASLARGLPGLQPFTGRGMTFCAVTTYLVSLL